MRLPYLFAVVAFIAVACHGNDSAKAGAGSPSSAPQATPAAVAPGANGSAAKPASDGAGSQVADAKPVPAKPDVQPEAKPADARPVPSSGELAPGGHDFTPEGKALLAVGACGDLPPPAGFDPQVLAAHCEIIKKAQADYLEQWVKPARTFFGEHVPSDIPRKVVYPFAGGDLSTALTVYPDADEITTLSLEPAGDPRDLAHLKGGELDKALKKV